jgi:transcriptional regulator with XRE-family HTH domain
MAITLHTGHLLRELRETRGLTRDALAYRAGVSVATLRNYERSPTFFGSASNLQGIAGALRSSRALTDEEMSDLRACLGAMSSVLDASPIPRNVEDHARVVDAQPWSNLTAAFGAGSPMLQQDSGQLLTQAVALFGEPEMRGLLAGLILSAALHRPAGAVARAPVVAPPTPAQPSPAPRQLHVAAPPVQRDGYVEQVVRTLEVPEPAPAAKPTGKPTSRKKRA